jgi:ADP-ribosylglycohydrolase
VYGVTLTNAMAQPDVLLAQEAGTEEMVRAVEAARSTAARSEVSRNTIEALGEGWVGEEALSIALFCALTVKDASKASVATALWRSVAHAGDSDSTGSLTGNLLGAMFGRECLPDAWLEELEMREVIERVASDMHASFVLGVEPALDRYPPT